MRKTKFTNNEYYHIYNRGVDKRKVFMGEKDYERFLISVVLLNGEENMLMAQWLDFKRGKPRAKLLDFLELSSGQTGQTEQKPLVEIIAYCFNPNHYHFILRQSVDRGITNFMHKLGTSYTNYFNQKYERTGSLFQGPFKSTHIETSELLNYLVAYVNCNSEIHAVCKAENYQWCSFPDYIGKRNGTLCNREMILRFYKDPEDYQKKAIELAKVIKGKRELCKLLLE